jgi:hypothetical protein
VTNFDLQSLGKKFIGALIDAPWVLPGMTDTQHRVTADDIVRFPLTTGQNSKIRYINSDWNADI